MEYRDWEMAMAMGFEVPIEEILTEEEIAEFLEAE